MRAIEILEEEHHLIHNLLRCLKAIADEAEEHGQVLSPHVADVLSLMEFFADGSHQRKEEEFLFSRLLRCSGLAQRLYVGRLFADHARERHGMRGLHANLMGAVYGDPLSVREFVVRARKYVQCHETHMVREDGVLFPMALDLLGEADDETLVSGFFAVDRGLPPGLDLGAKVRELCHGIGIVFEAEPAAEPVAEPAE